MDLSERLLYWRKQRGWTQQKLAKKLRVTPAAVCQWEVGYTPKRKPGKPPGKPTLPRTKHLAAAVEAFGLTMEEFYGPLPRTKTRKGRAA